MHGHPVTMLDDLHLGRDDALFLDFDGTLVDLGPDPTQIRLPPGIGPVLEALGRLLDGALCVISGRDVRDLVGRVPDSVWRAGGHGLDIVAPHESPPETPLGLPEPVLARLRAVETVAGVRLERKGPVAALHYRLAPEAAALCLAAATEAAAAVRDYVVMPGKCVVEVKPAGANKGAAVRDLMALHGFGGRRPVMLGDDTTDEHAMQAALDLGGVAVKVGPGQSVGRVRADDPAHVQRWLCREAGRLAQRAS